MYKFDKAVAVGGSKIEFGLYIDESTYFNIEAKDGDDQVGRVSCLTKVSGDCAFITKLGVIENYRENGIGTMLLLQAEETAAKKGMKYIGFFVDNESLTKWYEKRGYISAEFPNYHLMVKDISK